MREDPQAVLSLKQWTVILAVISWMGTGCGLYTGIHSLTLECDSLPRPDVPERYTAEICREDQAIAWWILGGAVAFAAWSIFWTMLWMNLWLGRDADLDGYGEAAR